MAFLGTRLIRSAEALIALVLLSLLAGCTPGSSQAAAPPSISGSLPAADMCDGYGAGGWSFAAGASDNDGLVLAGARLGPRQLVQQISVPYIEVTANWQGAGQDEMRRFELTRNPSSGHAGVGIALMTGGVTCQGSGTQSISASAEYAVQGLSAGMTILVWQSYRFDSGTTGCEPSEKLPCNRFWPTVEWGANEAAAGFVQSVRIVQRLQFDPDSGNEVAANIYRDRSRRSAALTGSSVQTLGQGSLKTETTQLAISSGHRIDEGHGVIHTLDGGCSSRCTWDSVHLTDRLSTSSPGDNPFDPTPGCSECVHVHWGWGTATNTICHGKGVQGCNHLTGNAFTDGRPETVDGSPQTAYLSVVRYSPAPDELDPVKLAPTEDQKKAKICPSGGYECLVDKSQSLAQGRDVLFWDMTSTGTLTPGAIVINGVAMATGDAAWPQLASFKHGGDGSMFFAPARILTPTASHLTVAPPAPSDAIHYPGSSSLGPPERWVLPVRITYSCTKKSVTQGPFWLAVNTDRSALLNADPATGAEPGSPAYVTVRAGTAPTTGAVDLGDTVTTMECQNSHRPLTLTTYVEFSRPPTAADLAGLTLLGAPDGTSDFTPWNPAAGKAATAYVTNDDGGAVIPVNLATGVADTPIRVGQFAEGIAITPDGKTAYVANEGDNTVTPVNLATGTPGVPIGVGKNPVEIAITPDGKTAYVTDNTGNSITPIDLATGAARTAIQLPVTDDPFGIAITPDGTRAYVTGGYDTIIPINLATGTVGAEIQAGYGPIGIAITPHGRTAYVTDYDGNTVTPIDLTTGTPSTPIQVGESPTDIAIAPDGRTVYVTDYRSNTVTPINVTTGTAEPPIQVGRHPNSIAITPDGRSAYVTDSGGTTVTPIDLATGTPGTPVHVSSTPFGIAIAP